MGYSVLDKTVFCCAVLKKMVNISVSFLYRLSDLREYSKFRSFSIFLISDFHHFLSQYTQQLEQRDARPSLANNLGNSVAPSATISVSSDFSRPIILDIGNEKIDLNVLTHSLQLFLVLSILLQLEVNFLAFMHFGLQKFGEEP